MRLLAKPVFRTLAKSGRLQLALLAWLSPSTAPIAAPFLRGVPARNQRTLTPAEAFAQWRVQTPGELYTRLHRIAE
ncbi:hypothetical protein [Nocardia tengchongensis]|uniref:hypothetical protein n=1 Tax=Nocardia tengchongensis TaxID=2055889 RepID=UPI003648201D